MTGSFLWRKISEKEHENIKKNAKQILDEFASKLEKIDVKESHFSRDSGMREQGEPWETSQEFRDVMFANAPDVDEDAIVAEKGGWK